MNQIWIFFTWSLVWTCCWSFNNRYNHNNNHQDEYDYQLDYHRPRDRQIALQLQAKAVENQGKSLLREAGDIGTQNTRSKESTNRSRPPSKVLLYQHFACFQQKCYYLCHVTSKTSYSVTLLSQLPGRLCTITYQRNGTIEFAKLCTFRDNASFASKAKINIFWGEFGRSRNCFPKLFISCFAFVVIQCTEKPQHGHFGLHFFRRL